LVSKSAAVHDGGGAGKAEMSITAPSAVAFSSSAASISAVGRAIALDLRRAIAA
jgi:hypothetical protein